MPTTTAIGVPGGSGPQDWPASWVVAMEVVATRVLDAIGRGGAAYKTAGG